MQLRVRDVCHGQSLAAQALILQQKTNRPVQFEITEPARASMAAWISKSQLKAEDFYSLAASTPRHIYRRASMRELSIHGFFGWDLTRPIMAPTRFEEQRPR